jgi:hypothetical protein
MSGMSNRPEQPTAEEQFDFRARVDELRCLGVAGLRTRMREVRREQARWRLEGLAVTRALEELDALDAVPDPTISARTAKSEREVARSLGSLPKVASAAWAGDLTWDQLQPVSEVATPATDAEWSVRGSRMAPVDLQRMARSARRVTAADAAARRQARYLTTWRDAEQGMVFGRWALPDVDGVLVEKVLDQMAERMRPAKGQPWDSLAHRKADALVRLCQGMPEPGVKRRKPVVVVHTNAGTPGGDVDGIPIAEETVAALRKDARVVFHDDAAPPADLGDGRVAIPVALERELERRDPHCRYPGCENTRGLQRHHLDPVAWGGRTSRKQLARLCSEHHRRMEPHGTERLIGDPDLPDGLTVKDSRADPTDRAGPAP